jgi:predicted DCC family thiol-disulfide oxidoreductase YuxK
MSAEGALRPAVGESRAAIRILFDAECPLCAREGWLLERLDRGRGRIELEDISAPDFDPGRYGLTLAEVEARLHGVLPDGRLVDGVEVLAMAYEAVGLGWLAAPARWPGVRWLLDRAYAWFARNRLRLTGRASLACGREGRCEVAGPDSPR